MARSSEVLEDSIYTHLKMVAMIKRVLLRLALEIESDYPNQAALLIRMTTELTRSADKLLSDTNVY